MMFLNDLKILRDVEINNGDEHHFKRMYAYLFEYAFQSNAVIGSKASYTYSRLYKRIKNEFNIVLRIVTKISTQCHFLLFT